MKLWCLAWLSILVLLCFSLPLLSVKDGCLLVSSWLESTFPREAGRVFSRRARWDLRLDQMFTSRKNVSRQLFESYFDTACTFLLSCFGR